VHDAIVAEAPLNALGLPDLAPDLGSGPDADGSQDGQEAVRAAALANSLGVLSGRQTGQEVRHHAQAAVIEAAEEAVRKLNHLGGGFFFLFWGG